MILPSHVDVEARKAKEQIVYSGFVAQDVEKAAKELSYDFSGVDAAKNDKDLYGLRYAEFVVPLVKAVQGLSAKNDELEKRVEQLEKAMNKQQQNNLSQATANSTAYAVSHNSPNPFKNSTSIQYSLSSKNSSAKIAITDYSGKVVTEIPLSSAGKGILTLQAKTFASGTYTYSLIIDGELKISKTMIVLK